MLLLDIISQYILMIFGPLSILFISTTTKYRKYGYIMGLCLQVFWYITLIYHEQYPILITAGVYTVSWIVGVWNFVIKNKEKSNESN